MCSDTIKKKKKKEEPKEPLCLFVSIANAQESQDVASKFLQRQVISPNAECLTAREQFYVQPRGKTQLISKL